MRDPLYRALQADYTLSAEAAYEKAFVYLLQHEKDLNLLVRQNEIERTLNLPSWMPDWTAEVEEFQHDLSGYFKGNLSIYSASGMTKREVHWPGTTSILSVKGLLFDEVVAVAERAPTLHAYTNPYMEYIQTLFNNTGDPSQWYIGGGNRQYAFWRLMALDQMLELTNGSNRGSSRRANYEDYTKCLNKYPPYGLSPEITFLWPAFRVFFTKMGYIGLGPENVQVGDTVHILLGASVPFVLRQLTPPNVIEQEPRHEYIGHCYVQGIMDGEALQDVVSSQLDWINLV